MTHARQQIRQQLVTTLTGLASTGSHVFASRAYDINVTPCLLIYTDSDQVNLENTTGATDYHELEITIEVRVKASQSTQSNVNNTVDRICKEVETALFADPTLNGLVLKLQLQNTEITLSSETDKPVAVATLTLAADYRIAPGSPGTIAN